MTHTKKILIIGGVAGGATAAARLRRLDEHAQIILVERGAHISFANCGLPYYIGGIIKERKRLFVTTPPAFHSRYNIDIRTRTEARRIDPAKQEVELYNLEDSSTYRETYDELILSPGASPIRPPIEGMDDSRIFTLRNIPDTDRIKAYLDDKHPAQALVVGGGYIGLEMAESLHHAGVRVTICEKLPQVMMPLDFEMAALVHRHMQTKNIEFYLNDGVSKFIPHPDRIDAVLESGKVLSTDMVVFSIGVRPELDLAQDAGLRIGTSGGIWVDEHLRTSQEHIYAIGDAIETTHLVTQEKFLVRLAGPANKQGRIAADNIYGREETYDGSLGTGVVRVFDVSVGSTGANEKMLKQAGIPYRASVTHSASHAGYYPGAVTVSIKLVFTPETGKVLGAQLIGLDGVDKRLDVIATAIMAGATVEDLEQLDLAYAPPYGSAKDPVNVAGYVAHNILKGDMPVIYWNEIDRISDTQQGMIVDVRTPREHALGTIPGAVNIPIDDLRQRLDEIPQDRPVYLYCQVGQRAYVAQRILTQHGFDVHNLSGGYKTYEIATGKQANEDIYEYDRITLNDEIRREAPPA
ncbi:CoA-disulfide reductase [candidate division KSB3 bacterium]|uniref:CoA-disulfide reductase n=1 Tax=candidate division KSB3 bacterium TaxID=2044937 RepID=A0A9D5JY13_9BACT|nr:CoA-disulfide reductase [candidate division KSB3 bacterium]MBD3326268.1 CoA-disulfide reductase [candidate division KSB3 bacterium]